MKRRLPPLNAIRAFEAAGRLQSISDAADELSVTPTAVSHQIRHLENLLEIKLFDRAGRNIALTQEGARILPALTQGMDSFTAAFEDTYGNIDTNTINISTTREFARYWLQPRLSAFYDAYPALTLNIYSTESAVDIANSEIDVAIRYGAQAPEGAEEIDLFQERYIPVVCQSLMSQTQTSDIGDLATKRLIDVRWESSSLNAPTWKNWFLQAGRDDFDDYRRMSFDAYNLALDALKREHGAALLSNTIVESPDFGAGLMRLDGPEIEGYHYRILRSPSAIRKRSVRQFTDWLVDAATFQEPADEG